MKSEKDLIVSVDTGGIFTDAAVINKTGKIMEGKALSTPKDFF